GYYRADVDAIINSTQTGYAGVGQATDNNFHRKDFTQELRIDSDFKGPINFTAGAFYQDGEVYNQITQIANILFPQTGTRQGSHTLDIKSYSGFGQLRWRPVEQVEISGGVRYTDEKRSDTQVLTTTGTPVGVPLGVPEIRSKTWSPEVTINY